MILSVAPADGTLQLIQLGVTGVALVWFATGKVHPNSTVLDLREQLSQERKSREAESADSKSIRDAIIKDVAPIMARVADRDKEVVELVTKLLAVLAQQGKG